VILAGHALVEGARKPTLERVREALAGNLCRCTGYEAIHRAVMAAHSELHGQAAKSAAPVGSGESEA
jgi:aerobic-type carbon monoxide dehydrogenase small subunit (CoxS/CutS family)